LKITGDFIRGYTMAFASLGLCCAVICLMNKDNAQAVIKIKFY